MDSKPCIILEGSRHTTAQELKENIVLLAHVSIKALQYHLYNNFKFPHYSASKKPIVTNHKKKISFCKKYLHWDEEKQE